MKRDVIHIVGTTATGKTALALALAQKLLQNYNQVDIISADSRQVFADIPIVSGADVPGIFTSVSDPKLSAPFLRNQNRFNVHGVGILAADQAWSLADFQRLVLEVAVWSWSSQGVVILVGGTGLYQTRVSESQLMRQPAPNTKLRDELSGQPLDQLQHKLQSLDSSRWQSLSVSDRANPRRLVRHIEVAVSQKKNLGSIKVDTIQPDRHIWVGLHRPWLDLENLIATRVQSRLAQGAVQEVERLMSILDFNQHLDLPIVTATGVKEIWQYLVGSLSLAEATIQWQTRERQYAKRQLTWWKKYGQQIEWFKSGPAVVDLVSSWHTTQYAVV